MLYVGGNFTDTQTSIGWVVPATGTIYADVDSKVCIAIPLTNISAPFMPAGTVEYDPGYYVDISGVQPAWIRVLYFTPTPQVGVYIACFQVDGIDAEALARLLLRVQIESSMQATYNAFNVTPVVYFNGGAYTVSASWSLDERGLRVVYSGCGLPGSGVGRLVVTSCWGSVVCETIVDSPVYVVNGCVYYVARVYLG